jgi:hypothetical protein
VTSEERAVRVEQWRQLARCAEGMAIALEEDDEIAGVLWSRGFLYAAADWDESFWDLMREEIRAARDDLAELAE